MEIDKTTLQDLSVFNAEEEQSIFHRLDFTRTTGGREQLRVLFNRTLSDIDSIKDTQETIGLIHDHLDRWPIRITNGTLMVIQKFFEASIDDIPAHASQASAYSYKMFHGPDFSLVKYSMEHCFDFIKGMMQMVELFGGDNSPLVLKRNIQRAAGILDKEQFAIVQSHEKADELSRSEMLHLAHFLRYHYKQNFIELEQIYYLLDAWYSMASAKKRFHLNFPEFLDINEPALEVKQLYHILLPTPVSYEISIDRKSNFLFLTGANMAGKSTFIKAVGAAVYLAHLGMPVPATEMKLSLFHGLLSNINVIDNIIKGESYFFNEVQRIKKTIIKINDGKKWLILIDELFKGTNVQDAMKCSIAVIEGLLKIKNSLFILSTHLYEIGESLRSHDNISFKYFETTVDEDQLSFSYQLKEGISNDRLGYLILKREKVLELLENL